jgi:hypothetical protein
MLVWFKIRNQ